MYIILFYMFIFFPYVISIERREITQFLQEHYDIDTYTMEDNCETRTFESTTLMELFQSDDNLVELVTNLQDYVDIKRQEIDCPTILSSIRVFQTISQIRADKANEMIKNYFPITKPELINMLKDRDHPVTEILSKVMSLNNDIDILLDKQVECTKDPKEKQHWLKQKECGTKTIFGYI